MLYLILLVLISLPLNAQYVHAKKEHVDAFKQLRPYYNDAHFDDFVKKLQNDKTTPGACIEEFIKQKKTTALTAIYGPESYALLEEEIKKYKRTHEEKPLNMYFDKKIPASVQKKAFRIAQEMNIHANVIVQYTRTSSDSSSMQACFAFVPGDNFIMRLNPSNFEHFGIFDKIPFIYLLTGHNRIQNSTLRHELTHLQKQHTAIETYKSMLELTLNKKDLKTHNRENELKLSRALETEADLLPLAYGPIEHAVDQQIDWAYHKKNYKNTNSDIYKPIINKVHPPLHKRLTRAQVIVKIKEAEERLRNPAQARKRQFFNFMKSFIPSFQTGSFLFVAGIGIHFYCQHLVQSTIKRFVDPIINR